MSSEYMKHIEQTVHLLRKYHDQSFVCHEREELVEKLLLSEDPYLRSRGVVESEFLMMRKTFSSGK